MNVGVLMGAYSGSSRGGGCSLGEKDVLGTEGWLGVLACEEESGTPGSLVVVAMVMVGGLGLVLVGLAVGVTAVGQLVQFPSFPGRQFSQDFLALIQV